MNDTMKLLFTHILTKFNNLQYLNICSNSVVYKRIAIDMSPLIVTSSTLLELHVSLHDLTDCLYLLDGRFKQLHTLFVQIDRITSSSLTMDNKVNYFD